MTFVANWIDYHMMTTLCDMKVYTYRNSIIQQAVDKECLTPSLPGGAQYDIQVTRKGQPPAWSSG